MRLRCTRFTGFGLTTSARRNAQQRRKASANVVAMSLLVVLGSLTPACRTQPPPVTRVIDGEPRQGTYVSPYAYEAFMRGELAMLSGDDETALANYAMARTGPRDDRFILSRIVRVLLRKGDLQAAESHFNEGVEMTDAEGGPPSSALWLAGAEVALAAGQAESAASRFIQSHRLEVNHSPAAARLADVLVAALDRSRVLESNPEATSNEESDEPGAADVQAAELQADIGARPLPVAEVHADQNVGPLRSALRSLAESHSDNQAQPEQSSAGAAAHARLEWGMFSGEANHIEAALEALREVNPAFLQTRRVQRRLLLAAARLLDTSPNGTLALTTESRTASAKRLQVRALLALDRREEARAVVAASELERADRALLWELTGDDALLYSEGMAALPSQDDAFLVSLAAAATRLGEFESAAELLSQVPEMSPLRSDADAQLERLQAARADAD